MTRLPRFARKAFSLTLIILFFLTVSSPASAVERGALTIAAASDLSYALREITGLFYEETGVKAAVSFGSTGMLAAQIRQGAPFDVFLSADLRHIEDLEKGGFIIVGTAGSFAEGALAIATNESTGSIVNDINGLL
ncbi:MAG: molybdate ABC transporter substrate-binding protein, partial [Deltaproteobacteria bacterium]|nr:molybdate ABC transporter substrate-binding protein [Deltaproteobacteria bacterium]